MPSAKLIEAWARGEDGAGEALGRRARGVRVAAALSCRSHRESHLLPGL